MDELLKLMALQCGRSAHAKQHLANHLGVSLVVVHKWFKQGYMPLARAIECEYLFGINRGKLIDGNLLLDVTGCVDI